MSDLLCVTNRHLCRDGFLTQIERIAKAAPAGIILREKDMSEREYKKLAAAVMDICKRHSTPCVLHSFVRTAIELGAEAIHLPLPILRTLTAEEKSRFSAIGASCHSVSDAIEAEASGCTYITAGHIFATDCKENVPPRGTDFLKEVCKSVALPVYAIGGISPDNAEAVIKAGAKGYCVMSGIMQCRDPYQYISGFKKIGGDTNEA